MPDRCGQSSVQQTAARLYDAERRALETWTGEEIDQHIALLEKYLDALTEQVQACKRMGKESPVMRIVTISREFGSGGRELGKRLADLLQWDYYDEIISRCGAKCGQNPQAVRHFAGTSRLAAVSRNLSGSIGSPPIWQSSQVDLLLKQKRC